ncbi:helix-turn-helix transcriptional regulator [Arthrobacter rhombi]|uniref:helix-turn-helix transcriptional regulator n=1 Tax=Arthrobacter rhombi TaxID=71253 RepID=UPI003FD034C5
MTETESRYLTREEAAAHLNVTVRWLATTGRNMVPSLHFGGNVRYLITDLDDWAAQQRKRRAA